MNRITSHLKHETDRFAVKSSAIDEPLPRPAYCPCPLPIATSSSILVVDLEAASRFGTSLRLYSDVVGIPFRSITDGQLDTFDVSNVITSLFLSSRAVYIWLPKRRQALSTAWFLLRALPFVPTKPCVSPLYVIVNGYQKLPSGPGGFGCDQFPNHIRLVWIDETI